MKTRWKVVVTLVVLALLAAGFVPGWFGYDLTHPKAPAVTAVARCTSPDGAVNDTAFVYGLNVRCVSDGNYANWKVVDGSAPQTGTAPAETAKNPQTADANEVVCNNPDYPDAQGTAAQNIDPDFVFGTNTEPKSPTTEWIDCVTGVGHMVRVSTEAATYQWNGYPHSTDGTCPKGPFLCTVHWDDGTKLSNGKPNGKIQVFTGEGQNFAEGKDYGPILAWTVRYTPGGFPEGDAVFQNPCRLTEKEDLNGWKDTRTFHVFPGNFSCENDAQMHVGEPGSKYVTAPNLPPVVNANKPITSTAATSTQAAPAKSASGCPTTPAAAAAAFGGAESQWSRMTNGGWKAEWSGSTFSLKVPKGYSADFDLDPFHPNGSASYVVGSASVYCQ